MGDIVNLKRGMLVLIVSILLVNIAYALIILGKNSLIVEAIANITIPPSITNKKIALTFFILP